MIANLIANRGKFVISFKDKNKEYEKYQEERTSVKPAYSTESSEDISIENNSNSHDHHAYHEHKNDFNNHNNENNKK